MSFSTSDLCDRFHSEHHLQIAEPVFRHFGGKREFKGVIHTLKTFEDDSMIEDLLHAPNPGVLVIDGGGSHRSALVGKSLAQKAVDQGWSGLLIYGCVRDSAILETLPIGIMALHSHPMGAVRKGHGDPEQLITFSGINFRSGYYLYADADGIVVAEKSLD